MSCCLTPSIGAREDFIAKAGCTVTLILKGPENTGAEIVHIRYAGTEIDAEPPFQFKVRKGPRILIVLSEASTAGAMLQLVEQCNDGTEQVVDRFYYDPMNPARGYIIKGISA
jgi:hypothetical protein